MADKHRRVTRLLSDGSRPLPRIVPQLSGVRVWNIACDGVAVITARRIGSPRSRCAQLEAVGRAMRIAFAVIFFILWLFGIVGTLPIGVWVDLLLVVALLRRLSELRRDDV